MDENVTPAPEVPTPAPIPGENPPPSAPPQGAPAAPPVTGIVISGTKTEREINLERQLAERDEKLTAAEREKRLAETRAAELERDNEELKKIPAPKRKHNWLSPVIGADEEN